MSYRASKVCTCRRKPFKCGLCGRKVGIGDKYVLKPSKNAGGFYITIKACIVTCKDARVGVRLKPNAEQISEEIYPQLETMELADETAYGGNEDDDGETF